MFGVGELCDVRAEGMNGFTSRTEKTSVRLDCDDGQQEGGKRELGR